MDPELQMPLKRPVRAKPRRGTTPATYVPTGSPEERARAALAADRTPDVIAVLSDEERARLKEAIVATPRPYGKRLSVLEGLLLKEAWLEAFARSGIIQKACDEVHVDRSTVLLWEELDAEFVLRKGVATAKANDAIRAEIERRAVHGVVKPVLYKGERVDNEEVVDYSDLLLIFLAKARMPEFRDKHEVSGPGGGPIEISDARERLLALIDKALVGADEAEAPSA